MLVKSAGGAVISPDGKWVAYTVTETDFKQDAYVTQIWLADAATGTSFQLTRGEKSSSNIDWSPDGRWLAFTSSRVGDKNQLFIISPAGGEAAVLTKSETGVAGYEWSPDSRSIAYTASDPASKAMKDRKEDLGDYDVVRRGPIILISGRSASRSP
jgi:Tol biopolymer transport system component